MRVNEIVFQRGQAFSNLENLSQTIAIHCVLVASYPDSAFVKHWEEEIDVLIRTVRRYNSRANGKLNFNKDIVNEIIGEHLSDPDNQEAIETYIGEKSLDIEKIDWKRSELFVENFVSEVFAV